MKQKRKHLLRSTRIVHYCGANDQTFTLRQWSDYYDQHDTTNEVVATVFGYNYTINDVCLNPTMPLKWKDKHGNFFCVTIARSHDGLFCYGYDYWFNTGGGCCAPHWVKGRVKGFANEREAIVDCINTVLLKNAQWALKMAKEYSEDYDDYGNVIKNTGDKVRQMKAVIKSLDDFKIKFNPQQLSLFEL